MLGHLALQNLDIASARILDSKALPDIACPSGMIAKGRPLVPSDTAPRLIADNLASLRLDPVLHLKSLSPSFARHGR
jgi:hypothetical protein